MMEIIRCEECGIEYYSETIIKGKSFRHVYPDIVRLETELTNKDKLLMKTNHVHIENQRLQKDLNGELETNQRLTDELTEAQAEIGRLNNKLSLLLCEDHVKSCESGLFNSKYSEDEPCLLCLIDIRQNQVEIDFKAKDKLIEQMKDALQRLRDEEKPTTYHDCIDDGGGECAWCQAMAALSAAEKGE